MPIAAGFLEIGGKPMWMDDGRKAVREKTKTEGEMRYAGQYLCGGYRVSVL